MKFKSRKQERKEFRKAKKLKKHEFFSKKRQRNQSGNNPNPNPKNVGEGSPVKNKEIEKVAQKVEKLVNKEKKQKEFKNPHEKQQFEREKERKEKAKLDREIRQQRVKQLKADNMKEDIEIKKLEKQLKMRNGKSKAFSFDGLDYLLDVCNKTGTNDDFEKALGESDSEFESDLENIVGNSKKKEVSKKKDKKKKVEEPEEDSVDEDEENDDFDEMENDDELVDEEEAMDEELEDEEEEVEDEEDETLNSEADEDQEEEEIESDISDEVPKKSKNQKRKKDKQNENKKTKKKKVEFEEPDSESDISGDDDENECDEEAEEENKKLEAKMWEDIYGRTRDEKGNVVKTYTPPHLRKKAEGGDMSEKIARLRKQLKGLLNRLAESNMGFISSQIEQLYMQNSRNDMNETLCGLFNDSLMTEILTPERLITEHAMLIAVLHANIGSEIGAHFLQYAVTEFCRLLESNPEVEDKKINNVLMFIMHLYNFQIFHSKLMYDLINELMKNLEEKQIELLLATLRTVGFNLRKDDPVALKSLVLKVQDKANTVSTGENSSRVKFMLEMLMAIKNNNMSKIPNYNPEFVEKLRKNLKVLVRKGNYSTELNISLEDLLNAEKHGRWWIVGSAWSGTAPSKPDSNNPKPDEVPSTEFSQKLLELAKKQRMNTDVRRNIFCILMSAEDYLEAFEKLLKLKLKGAVEREIMNVLLHCALQEKNFNPYYVYLANKFCTFDRKYQMMLQCAVWDKIKELKNALPVQVTNLAKFVGNMILERGLPMSILKVIQFSDLDKPTIKFMRQVLLAILVSEDRTAIEAAFKRIADSPKLKLFRESLRLFLQHFVLKNTAKNNVQEEKVSRLADMVKVAEQALTSWVTKMIF